MDLPVTTIFEVSKFSFKVFKAGHEFAIWATFFLSKADEFFVKPTSQKFVEVFIDVS
jgi:hypothetical protein